MKKYIIFAIFLFNALFFCFIFVGLSCNYSTGFLASYYVEAPVVTVDRLSGTSKPTWHWNSVKNAVKYIVSFDKIKWQYNTPTSYTPDYLLSNGENTLYVRAINEDESKSSIGSATTIVLEDCLEIVDKYYRPRKYMNTLDVKLLISVNNVIKNATGNDVSNDFTASWMRFSEDNSNWSGSSWTQYSSTKDWTFTNDGDKEYTIYAQFKDGSSDILTQYASVEINPNSVYVSGVVMDGDPTTDGSKEYPFTTITEGINYANVVHSGTYPDIMIASGTYSESIDLSNTFSIHGAFDSTSWSQHVDVSDYETILQSNAASTITCQGNNRVEGFTIKSTATTDNSATLYITGSNVVIIHNKIYNADANNVSTIYADAFISDILIKYNEIYGDATGGGNVTAYAVNFNNVSSSRIVSNWIEPATNYNSAYGIYFSNTQNTVTANNILYADQNIWDTELYGISINNDTNYRIRNNSIVFNGSNSSFNRGIVTNSVNNGYINNNILYIRRATNHNYGITYSNTMPSVSNNDIYIDGSNGDEGNIRGDGSNFNVFVNPQFNNLANGDFHLTDSSPYCITYGGINGVKNSWDSELNYDLDSQERTPNDSSTETSWSMGAFEYDGGNNTISIYVNGSIGNDTNGTGEQSGPFKSISTAISKSDMLGRGLGGQWCNILVAQDIYTEDVLLDKSQVWMYGGYSADWSVRNVSTYPTTIEASSDGSPAIEISGINTKVIFDGFVVNGYDGGMTSYGIKIDSCQEVTTSNCTAIGGITNAAGGTVYGIYIDKSTATIYNSVINGGSNSMGANTYGIYIDNNSAATIYNNIINGGSTFAIGKSYAINTTGGTNYLYLYNNTIDAGSSTSEVVGIQRNGATTYMDNNIIFYSGSALTKTGIDNTNDANLMEFKKNDIFGFSDTYSNDNITVNPNFQDQANGNYHLTTSTPIEVKTGGLNGNNQGGNWPSFYDDIEGTTRTPADSTSQTGWSMGAYEKD